MRAPPAARQNPSEAPSASASASPRTQPLHPLSLPSASCRAICWGAVGDLYSKSAKARWCAPEPAMGCGSSKNGKVQVEVAQPGRAVSGPENPQSPNRNEEEFVYASGARTSSRSSSPLRRDSRGSSPALRDWRATAEPAPGAGEGDAAPVSRSPNHAGRSGGRASPLARVRNIGEEHSAAAAAARARVPPEERGGSLAEALAGFAKDRNSMRQGSASWQVTPKP